MGPFEIADKLHSAAIHLLRRLRAEDDAIGLSAPRLSALSVVVFAGPLTLSELAAAEQVRLPTISRLIKDSKLKVTAALQGDKVRITGKSRDDLQQAIQLLRTSKLETPLQFNNFRD